MQSRARPVPADVYVSFSMTTLTRPTHAVANVSHAAIVGRLGGVGVTDVFMSIGSVFELPNAGASLMACSPAGSLPRKVRIGGPGCRRCIDGVGASRPQPTCMSRSDSPCRNWALPFEGHRRPRSRRYRRVWTEAAAELSDRARRDRHVVVSG